MIRDEIIETMARAIFDCGCIEKNAYNSPDYRFAKGAAQEKAESAISALEAKGLVVAPREPTEAMREAGGRLISDTYDSLRSCGEDDAKAIYRTMLAAFEKQGG